MYQLGRMHCTTKETETIKIPWYTAARYGINIQKLGKLTTLAPSIFTDMCDYHEKNIRDGR